VTAVATSTLLDAALRLASRGMHVIPLRGKIPVIENGSRSSSADPDQIRAWWSAHPEANIGIVTGPSGLVMIDLDGPEASDWWAERQAEHGAIDTVMAFSGRAEGGAHLYFRAPQGVQLRAKVGKIGPHVDVRNGFTYAVAPPSIHPDTGTVYRWGQTRGFAELPPWLIELCKEQVHARRDVAPPSVSGLLPYVATALSAEVSNVATAVEGTRNATLNTAALNLGQLVGSGALPRILAEDSLYDAAMAIGLGESETRNTIRSGLDAGLKMPRRPPVPTSGGRGGASSHPTARPLPSARPTQARWAAAPEIGPDPFGGPPAAPTPESAGLRIALIEPSGDLGERLLELLDMEQTLNAQGVTCPIKSQSDTCCLACPLAGHEDPADPRGPLCRVGREQDQVHTRYAAANEVERAARG
jgi:hypothetical protein